MNRDEFLADLTRERFEKPTPKPPKRNPISGLALAELLADLNPAEDEEKTA